jgi:predicted PurR-regulated permease PerM
LDLPQVVAGIQAQSGTLLKLLTGVGQGVAQALITLGLTLFTVFFFYRSGEELVAQGYRGLARWGGEAVTSLLEPLAAIIRAVVLGVVVTALAQGLLAGIGFAVAGLGGSLILGLMVVLVALVQLPTALIWLPCAVWLLSQGQLLSGALLFAWGLGVVSTIDNFLKPIFISQGTGLPFLLVFLGILGGLLAFGTPGLVLGPALLALLQILWQRWSSAS